jgi:hypothetical protein
VIEHEKPAREGNRGTGSNIRSHKQDTAVLLRRNYTVHNLEAAKIIIADSSKWGGPEAGLVRWAWIVLGRLQPQRNLLEGGLR